jgi:hypothetical protein
MPIHPVNPIPSKVIQEIIKNIKICQKKTKSIAFKFHLTRIALSVHGNMLNAPPGMSKYRLGASTTLLHRLSEVAVEACDWSHNRRVPSCSTSRNPVSETRANGGTNVRNRYRLTAA